MSDVPLTAPSESPAGQGWIRQYPPLITLVVALLIAFLVLPSALNLPQSNPSTVLEFAPVPPEDDTPPPQSAGSLSSLGLGTSQSLSADTPPAPPVTRGGGGQGERATSKRCVGDPPRQTEDPNSPPCVGFFDGDNGGNTWQGVTGEKTTVVIYQQAYISDQSETEGGDTSAGEYAPAVGSWCDIDKPSTGQSGCNDRNTGREMSNIHSIRALSRYFNERYQTYGRHVNLWVYWTGASTPSARRADAQQIWETQRPFATIDFGIFGGYNEVYASAIARREVMVFGTFGALANSFYRELAPKLWSFWPDVEHDVEMYVSYVCSRVAPYPASRAGSPELNNRPRKYALMYTTDQTKPGYRLFAARVIERLKACGIDEARGNAIRITFPEAGYTNDSGGDHTYPGRNIATMQDEEVTTVLWLQGMEPKTTAAADRARYYPEWVVAGDRHIDDLINGRAQNQRVWNHAWVATAQLREDRFADTPARQAYREVEPNGRQIHEYYATVYYRDLFTIFRSIQVAGPYLSPFAVDQGNHAIPRYSSNSPLVAACFYDPGDYSCVKDAHEAHWDSDAPDPNGEPGRGCWRLVRGGQRYLAGEWPKGDATREFSPTNPCNGVKGSGHNRLPV